MASWRSPRLAKITSELCYEVSGVCRLCAWKAAKNAREKSACGVVKDGGRDEVEQVEEVARLSNRVQQQSRRRTNVNKRVCVRECIRVRVRVHSCACACACAFVCVCVSVRARGRASVIACVRVCGSVRRERRGARNR
eukprot:6192165-Pleurochrysis_carterae.AAC.2